MVKINKNIAGFTLLETMMVIFLFSLICTVSVSMLYAILRTTSKAEMEKEVRQSGDFSLNMMRRMIQSAQMIADCTDVTQLTIENPDGKLTTFRCDYNNNVARIASVSAQGNVQALTAKTVTLGTNCSNSSLTFSCTTPASGPQVVTINFTLSQSGVGGKPEEKATIPFQSTIGLRTY